MDNNNFNNGQNNGQNFQQGFNNFQQGFNNFTQLNDPSIANSTSSWDGGVLETLVAMIVSSLIVTFTCGIATPWAICYMIGFIISHVTIDGRRLTFDGTGAQLFGNWIKWFVLIVITCGIYSFWVIPKVYNWIAKHTHFNN